MYSKDEKKRRVRINYKKLKGTSVWNLLYIKVCIEKLITLFTRNMIRTSYIYKIWY